VIGPILRLVLIYLVLIAAVVAVFNRDKLAALFGGGAPEAVAAAPAPVTPPVVAVTPPVVADPTPTPAPQPAPAPSAPSYGSDLQTPTAPAAPEAAAPEVPQIAPAPDQPDQPDAARDAALATAIANVRQAFWQGDIEGARAQMRALAAAHPDNIEIAGELGNLHFALRDYPAAAGEWHRAGLLMIAAGQGQRLMSLLPALRSIDPDRAADLAARLQGR
jgi:hypothetical protein